jgi:serine/threonine-protein kinase
MSESAAATTLPEAASLVGTTIAERYKVESVLGEGGMGAVYLVQHTHMRKRYALKVLHPETSKNPELVARFEREAVASAHADHPNITAATDFGRAENGAFYLVLEYLEGRRLRDVLAEGPLPLPRALHIARQVASALGRAHELGIIHRDLKPENIMLVHHKDDADFVKVLDFGLAKVAVDALAPAGPGDEPLKALTKHGSVFGTPRYMAPEQCVGDTVDGRADLYALGLILYEMLAGRHPFDGQSSLILIKHQLTTPVPPMKDRAPAVRVPAAVEAVVMRLTQKRPQSRYATARELEADLAALMPAEGSGGSAEKLAAAAAPAAPVLAAPTVAAFDAAAPPADAAPPPAAPAVHPPAGTASGLKSTPLLRRLLLLLLPLLLFIGVVLLLSRRSAPSRVQTPRAQAAHLRSKPTPPMATKAQLDAAIAAGIPALTSLAAQYPEDAHVLRALAHTHMAQQDGLAAVRVLGQTIARDASLVGEGELLQAALMAMSNPESAEAVIALLETGCGARGVDVLYALATRTGAGHSKLRTRISQSLTRPQVRALATPAALVALDLRAAIRCEAKRALLGRAATDGDERTLVQLKPLLLTKGCSAFGHADCWPCLRLDTALQDAINAIAARGGPGK